MQIKIYYMKKNYCSQSLVGNTSSRQASGVPSSSTGLWAFPDPIPFSLLLPVYIVLSQKHPKM